MACNGCGYGFPWWRPERHRFDGLAVYPTGWHRSCLRRAERAKEAREMAGKLEVSRDG
jgi:hypothetical protein